MRRLAEDSRTLSFSTFRSHFPLSSIPHIPVSLSRSPSPFRGRGMSSFESFIAVVCSDVSLLSSILPPGWRESGPMFHSYVLLPIYLLIVLLLSFYCHFIVPLLSSSSSRGRGSREPRRLVKRRFHFLDNYFVPCVPPGMFQRKEGTKEGKLGEKSIWKRSVLCLEFVEYSLNRDRHFWFSVPLWLWLFNSRKRRGA